MFFCMPATKPQARLKADACAEHARGMGTHNMACMLLWLKDLKQGLFFLPLSNFNFCILISVFAKKIAAKLT